MNASILHKRVRSSVAATIVLDYRFSFDLQDVMYINVLRARKTSVLSARCPSRGYDEFSCAESTKDDFSFCMLFDQCSCSTLKPSSVCKSAIAVPHP